jgi:hypothetical protein
LRERGDENFSGSTVRKPAPRSLKDMNGKDEGAHELDAAVGLV